MRVLGNSHQSPYCAPGPKRSVSSRVSPGVRALCSAVVRRWQGGGIYQGCAGWRAHPFVRVFIQHLPALSCSEDYLNLPWRALVCGWELEFQVGLEVGPGLAGSLDKPG